MKTTSHCSHCWVLSSHGHPCAETAWPAEPVGATRRSRPAPIARRPTRRAATLSAYWMQADEHPATTLGRR